MTTPLPHMLTITVDVDPPLTEAATAGRLTDEIVRMADVDHALMTTHEPGTGRVTWTLSMTDPDGLAGRMLYGLQRAVYTAVRNVDGWEGASIRTLELTAVNGADVERRTAEHAARQAVIGVDEFRELLGTGGKEGAISRARLYELRTQPGFPPSIARGVWPRAAAERYALTRNTVGGRPRATGTDG